MGIGTVNEEVYIDILLRLRYAVRMKRPEQWRTNSWFLLHDNASVGLFNDFLASNNVAAL
jgi:hypothetical protein